MLVYIIPGAYYVVMVFVVIWSIREEAFKMAFYYPLMMPQTRDKLSSTYRVETIISMLLIMPSAFVHQSFLFWSWRLKGGFLQNYCSVFSYHYVWSIIKSNICGCFHWLFVRWIIHHAIFSTCGGRFSVDISKLK